MVQQALSAHRRAENASDQHVISFQPEMLQTPGNRFLVSRAIQSIAALPGVHRLETSRPGGQDTVSKMVREVSAWSFPYDPDETPEVLGDLVVVFKSSEVDPSFLIQKVLTDLEGDIMSAAKVKGHMVAIELPRHWADEKENGFSAFDNIKGEIQARFQDCRVFSVENYEQRPGEHLNVIVMPKNEMDMAVLRKDVAAVVAKFSGGGKDLVATDAKNLSWFMAGTARVYNTAMVSSGDGHVLNPSRATNSFVQSLQLCLPDFEPEDAAVLVDAYDRAARGAGVNSRISVQVGGNKGVVLFDMQGDSMSEVNKVFHAAMMDTASDVKGLMSANKSLRAGVSKLELPSPIISEV